METNTRSMKEERKQDPKTSSDTADEAPVSKKQKADASRSKQASSAPVPKRNAFFNFLDWQRSTIKGSSQKEVVRRAGEIWQKLTDEEKKPYYDMADAARANGKPVRKTPPAKRKIKQSKGKDNPDDGGAGCSYKPKGKRSKKDDRADQVMAVK